MAANQGRTALSQITITNGVLEIIIDDDGTEIMVLRGNVDPDCLHMLLIDTTYQREELTPRKIDALADAFRVGEILPDIDLGMRGDDCIEVEGEPGTWRLSGRTYIIDGQQRRAGALKALEEGHRPRLGAVVHFNTTRAWERHRFDRLNLCQTKLGANVALRNLAADEGNTAARAILQLSRHDDFLLQGRVQWSQNMAPRDMITARNLLLVVARLHAHMGPGRSNGSVEIVEGLQKIAENCGIPNMRANIIRFFELIDEVWGIPNADEGFNRADIVWMKQGFIYVLAAFLSDHYNFWEDGKLVIDKPTIDRLRRIDPVSRIIAGWIKGGNEGANIERVQIPISRDAAQALGAALFKQVSIVISDEEAPSA
jgi:hypothetical protein